MYLYVLYLRNSTTVERDTGQNQGSHMQIVWKEGRGSPDQLGKWIHKHMDMRPFARKSTSSCMKVYDHVHIDTAHI
jgi:hypothetical protein